MNVNVRETANERLIRLAVEDIAFEERCKCELAKRKACMKVTDYMVVTAGTTASLRLEILTMIGDGWEIYGGPMLLQKPVEFSQAMVKKFDPHAGEVWVKEPGLAGRWEKAT